ncbi:hypothetical protein ACG3SL_09395 [Sphingomonas sp. CJ20]
MASLAALLAPMLAHAQSEAGGAGKISSIGSSDDTLASMRLELAITQFRKSKCWDFGCLIIVNETDGYDVIAFHIATRPDTASDFSRNRFEGALAPHKASLAVKTGNAATCDMPVRFVLRQQKTHERITLDGRANLCVTPHSDSIVHVKVLEPKVSIDPDPPQAPPAH